jgi:hypothetical protein
MPTPTIYEPEHQQPPSVKYVSDRPCTQCGGCERYRKTQKCVACAVARATRWSASNRLRRREISRRYREANAEACNRRSLAWGRANVDHVRDLRRRHYKAHPEQVLAKVHRRRAHRLSAPGRGVTPKEWGSVIVESGGRCAYCALIAPLEMDHIDPISIGGAHDVENLAPACRACNSSKNALSLVMWLASGRYRRCA